MLEFLKAKDKPAAREPETVAHEPQLAAISTAQIEELNKLRAALDNTSTALMMVDRDLVVTYVNKATHELLSRNEDVFKSVFPGFNLAGIVGTCVDVFHKKPEHQRQLLSDPSNLPWKTDIKVAHLEFALTVTAQMDSSGAYVGNTLEWADVTKIRENERQNTFFKGQIEAISRSQAVIEFDRDLNILKANENFLNAMGYTMAELEGQHHSIFVTKDYRNSSDYENFKQVLKSGSHHSGEFCRIGKDGSNVWIQATYNPILDDQGNVDKIVKFAVDITDNVTAREERDRVGKIVDENLGQILSSVGDVNSQTTAATNASGQTLQTVQSVAAASEEFQASAGEIARSMETSRGDVIQAREEADSAGQATEKLAEATQSMTSIVTVIQDIASQINLLALNATIESARAGEAGRGFAVVASEVKSLANQVGGATEKISEEIGAMQTVSDEVIAKLNDIKASVESVESSVTTVASAVEEQAATTQEISNSMQSATIAVSEVNASLESITGAVEHANKLAMEGTELYRSLNN